MQESEISIHDEIKQFQVDQIQELDGKIIIITGANSGIGFEAAKSLTEKNATIIMACRNLEKAKLAKERIKHDLPKADLDIIEIDLGSLKSIRNFVSQFSENYNQLDVLINNAGVFQAPQLRTDDGFELHFGVNHLGHFALTGLLFGLLHSTTHSRVITQTSFAHTFGKIHFDDIHLAKKYSRTNAYTQSKLANLLFAIEFDERIKASNCEISSIAVHPGISRTNLFYNGPMIGGRSLWYPTHILVNRLWAQSTTKGVLPTLFAATAENIEGGEFIGPKGLFSTRGRPKILETDEKQYNKKIRAKLWDLSEELTNIHYSFA